MLNVQNRMDLSNTEVLDLAAALRVDGVEIEPNLREDLYDSHSGKLLSEYFEVKEMPMEVKNENDLEVQNKSVVVCKNVEAFVEFVKEKRNVKNNVTLRYGADGGGMNDTKLQKIEMNCDFESFIPGEFFKICLNIVEEKTFETLKKSKRKRAKYLDSSVKKLFILAIVQGVPETRENVKNIMSALNLEDTKLDFCLTTDMKLQNILVGIQSSSATFPCPYCESARPFEKNARKRTLGRLRELARKFRQLGVKKKDAKDYFNAIYEPILNGEDDEFILDLLPIPELHLHIGIGKICVQKIEIV